MSYNIHMGIFSPRTKVAVLRGGPSHGYEQSLKTGAHVLSVLRELPELYEPMDIFISREGEWHRGGLVLRPEQALHDADVAWNALHGHFGEDGQVQQILETLKIPYTGSEALASSLSHNKHMTKDLYKQHSLLTPESQLVTEEDLSDEKLVFIFRNFMHPVVVKPADGVHSLGVRLAHTFHELKEAIKETFKHSPKVLVEEHVKGTLVSCYVVENARGESLYTLIPTGSRPQGENEIMSYMSRKAHEALGLRHYSSSDFIITPRGRIYILETNALPAIHDKAPLQESLRATGWKSDALVKHLLELALSKR